MQNMTKEVDVRIMVRLWSEEIMDLKRDPGLELRRRVEVVSNFLLILNNKMKVRIFGCKGKRDVAGRTTNL